ncbi:unnamed protein product [Scytosiphon promiscuus]
MEAESRRFDGGDAALHVAAQQGSERRAAALLSNGSIDINQTLGQHDFTPLMVAAQYGHSRVVRLLLRKGASISVADTRGYTVLHVSAQSGRLAVTKMLLGAGSDLHAKSTQGATPLHIASDEGHAEVMQALIEAGADPDCRSHDGATPMLRAAREGHLEAIRVLLRANANLMLACKPFFTGEMIAPLQMAAQHGFDEMVREMIKHGAIEGLDGAIGGIHALSHASGYGHVDVMATLTDAGVIGCGQALFNACVAGHEACVKFFLLWQQKRGKDPAAGVLLDWDSTDFSSLGKTPLLESIDVRVNELCRPRIVRLLIDAGADTRSRVRFRRRDNDAEVTETPLDLTTRKLDEKMIDGEVATEEQLHRLEAVRRLLLQVQAVRAISWSWPRDVHASFTDAGKRTRSKRNPPVSMRTMLPLLRRRARKRGVLLGVAVSSRYSSQKCGTPSA